MERRDIRNILRSNYFWILLAVIILFTALVRIRLLSTPLERDEGEYAYMGQLLLQGIAPFKEAFNMKLPGTSMVYALFLFLFGETLTAVHLGLLIVNAISIVFVFLLGRKLFDPAAGIIAAASFALITLSPYLFGFAAHATHFVILFALGGSWALLEAIKQRKDKWFIISGLLFGTSFIMKQPGIFFFLFALAVIILPRFTERIPGRDIIRTGLIFTGCFFVPLAIVIGTIVIGGTFNTFWFWIVQYSFTYGSTITGIESKLYFDEMMHIFWNYYQWFCILSAIGIALICAGRFPKFVSGILFSFLFFSILSVLPGWHFRKHYFILVIPAFSLIIGSVFYFLLNILKNKPVWKYIPAVIFLFVIGDNIYTNRAYYFTLTPEDIVKKRYGANYFAESMNVSNYIAAHTAADDRIAIIGSEPQILFYSKRRSVSGHIYVYGMVEPQPYAHRMQEEFIKDIELAKPKYIVYARIGYSWLPHPNSDKHIIQWFKQYSQKYYRSTGVVDLIRTDSVKYIWENDANRYIPSSDNAIFIFERTMGNK